MSGKSRWTEEAWNKRIETLRKNGTFNTSKREEELYQELILKYGKGNIERNYNKDPRYPFQCDFYIKSEDLFIELNYSWTHGGHPFDPNNPKDIETLNRWEEKSKASKYYEIAIEVWTKKDPLKIQTAKENNLNYILYYK